MERKALEESKDRDGSLEAGMINSLLGFSRLFKLLVELRKPIVGHNLLLDLMIMYNQFHEPLPGKLIVFYLCCNPRLYYMGAVFIMYCHLQFKQQRCISKNCVSTDI